MWILLIILEGCDGAGKTTLARRLEEALGAAFPGDRLDRWRKTPPRSHPLTEYEQPLFHYRPGTGHHVICDRWHVGEAVYPRVLNRTTHWDDSVRRHVDLFLESRGALVIHVDPPHRELRRRFTERGGDPLVTLEQLTDLRLGYHTYFAGTRLSSATVSGADPLIVEKIITTARALDARAAALNPFVTYVGSPDPSYLILGDARHELKDTLAAHRRAGTATDPRLTINNGPAFGPYPSTSGHFLLRHLPQSLFSDGVGLANACDVDDVHELRRTLGFPPTVALGVNAWRCLQDSITGPGIGTLGAVPHPQYWRRFFNKYGSDYATIIEQAALYGKNMLGWRPDNTWYDSSKSTA